MVQPPWTCRGAASCTWKVGWERRRRRLPRPWATWADGCCCATKLPASAWSAAVRLLSKLERGETFDAGVVIANLTPWNAAALLGEAATPRLRRLPAHPPATWGAFVVYAGVDGSVVPAGFPLHHQVIVRRPLGEGNTIFLSLSPEWDAKRAPAGKRALTISTHTNLEPWWELSVHDRAAYETRQSQYAARLLEVAERVLPGLRQAAELVLPGTPLTFERFTGRARGWVGGFQQTGLLQAWGPRLSPNLWLVGDSIFPGQSLAATALGGIAWPMRFYVSCMRLLPNLG